MADLPMVRVEAAWGIPAHVAPEPGDWVRIDDVCPLRRVSITRGVNMRVADIEPGEAVVMLDNSSRALDPSNPASPWWPHVQPRTHLRLVAEVTDGLGGTVDRPLFAGLVESWPITWELTVGEVELTVVDAFALLGEQQLTRSVYRSEILDVLGNHGRALPRHYWALNEPSSTRRARDSIGSAHGTWTDEPGGEGQLFPWDDPGDSTETSSPDQSAWQRGARSRAVIVPRFRPGESTVDSIGFDCWVRFTRPPVPIEIGAGNLWVSARLVHIEWPGHGHFGLWVRWSDNPAEHGTPFVWWTEAGGPGDLMWPTPVAIGEAPAIDRKLDDGNLHHVRVLVDRDDPADVWLWLVVDGVVYATSTGRSWPADASRPGTLTLGVHNPTDVSGFAGAGVVGHVAWWHEVDAQRPFPLWDDFEYVADIDYAAGVDPWGDHTTSGRFEALLEVVELSYPVDAEQSDVRCAPAVLQGGALDYVRKIVATEQQGAAFIAADGRAVFRRAGENDPTPTVRFAGAPDPLDPGVIPYQSISPAHTVDRVVNVAEVSRPGADEVVRVEDPDSIARYGPVAVQIDTLARTPGQAQSIGAQVIARNREARTVIESMQIACRSADVPALTMLELELGDCVEVTARPPGVGDPIVQRSWIERLEHEIDYGERDWRMSIGLVEVVTLPVFTWDDPAGGWDRAVWSPAD